jgi:hypothetical protein
VSGRSGATTDDRIEALVVVISELMMEGDADPTQVLGELFLNAALTSFALQTGYELKEQHD